MVRDNLRIALTVLTLGFALEGLGELYTLVTPGATTPGGSALFLLPALLALVGVGFMWAGRDEWTAVHRVRARAASHVFGASVFGGVVAVGVVAALVEYPGWGIPWWAPLVFGVAMTGLIWGTAVTYAYLLFDLLSRPMRVVVVAAIAWAFLVSAIVGDQLAGNLGTVLSLITQHQLTVPAFVGPVDASLSLLFLTFFLLCAAAVEAHITVVRNRIRFRKGPVASNRRTPKPLEPGQAG